MQQFLQLPVLRGGRPEVLTGSDLDTREVRWVHTSEIFEIPPLLKGGEVLLTTGLGLVGASADAQRTYARGLAARGLAALVLELGRTFPQPPGPLVTAAKEAGLPLVVLHAVVPFIEVTEAVHPLLLTGEIEMLRLTERITSELTEALLAGSGLPGLLRSIAALGGCPARVLAADGHQVAGSPGAATTAVDGGVPAAVELFGQRWGTLMIDGSLTPLRSVLAARGAQAVSLELARTGRMSPVRQQAGNRLIRDLLDRRYAGLAELESRTQALGIGLRAGQRYVAGYLATEGASSRHGALAAATVAAQQVLRGALVADLSGELGLIGGTDAADVRRLAGELASRINGELGQSGGGQAVGLAMAPATDLAGLPSALLACQEASQLARRLGTGGTPLLAGDLGVHRLLGRLTTDPDLADFIDEQLGPLLDHDSAKGSELVRTLEEYLGAALSKTVAAQRLGIRRQTLYARLDRIDSLLGGLDLASRERRTAIDLALVGWRLRSAAVISRRR